MECKYNYSIIIPHKNIPELLERCLASIPERDDVQVIVVDDDSDPAVVDFARFPGVGRANTEVVFTRGEDGRKGAGYARNVGMERATGRWLVFADADDFFLPPLAGMMDKYLDSGADIVFFGNIWVDSETMLPISSDTRQDRMIEQYISSGNEYGLRYGMFAPWAKFVKRRLVEENKLRFSEIIYSNDILFSIMSGHLASSVECDPTPVYTYLRRSSSLCGVDNENFDSLSVRFGEDLRVVRFLRSVDKIDRYFDRMILKRWKRLMRIDRRRALALLPALKEFYPAGKITGLRLKSIFDPLIQKIKNTKTV